MAESSSYSTSYTGANQNFAGKDDRADAWLLTCDRWQARGVPALILPINPEALELKYPITGTEVTMYGGKNIVTRRNPRTGSVFDYPILSIKFNSGNIIPAFSQQQIDQNSSGNLNLWTNTEGLKPADGDLTDNIYGRYADAVGGKAQKNSPYDLYQNKEIPVGVQNLYALLSLVNEPWLLKHKTATHMNRIQLHTDTLAFPSMIFYGYVQEDGISWNESVDNYNNFDISFSLVVTHTNPAVSRFELKNLIATYKSNMGSLGGKRARYDANFSVESFQSPKQTAAAAAASTANDNGTCLDGSSCIEPELTLLDKINALTASVNSASTTLAGENGIKGDGTVTASAAENAGLLRNAMATAASPLRDQTELYAQRALEKVDPTYAATTDYGKRQNSDAVTQTAKLIDSIQAPGVDNPSPVLVSE